MSDTPLFRDFEDADEDALSFCDLPFSAAALDQPDGFSPALPPTSPLRDPSDFEFSAGPAISAVDAFLFCGKSIPYDEREYRVDSLLLRSDSFGRLKSFRQDGAKIRFASGQLLRSVSLRLKPNFVVPAAASVGSSSFRRRHRAVIGVTKFPARMELSDIRKRQRRRAPAQLNPPPEGGKILVAGGRSGGRWSLFRTLRRRSHFPSVLAKASLGCIPHA